MEKKPKTDEIPLRWHWLMRRFRRFASRYIRKRFHAVRVSKSSVIPKSHTTQPILFVLNHPSWWDPMICIIISEHFRNYEHFAPIDAEMLKRYGILKQLGFYPIERKSVRNIAKFLQTSLHILNHKCHAVWITAQGEFRDARQRPLQLQPGVGHIAARMEHGWIVPIALEYGFWDESQPEAFIAIGKSIDILQHAGFKPKEWLVKIETELTHTLDSLNVDVLSRDKERFTQILAGSSGVGGVYDLWRRMKSWGTGRSFDPSHKSNRG